ncbi:MAG: 4-hydroxy-tetrahydrodipicolinate reductase, partial [Candidatus Competibacteraceae bacterium]|nr:4-hydroxy-tetrahydrodipicolinate reductase [Candidatus Competibacteraceae bacterium]
MINVAVTGAAGRMGRMLVSACQQADGVRCSAALEQASHSLLGADAGDLAGVGKLDVSIGAELSSVLNTFDVLIDFTRPEATLANLEQCRAAGKRMVIGTTGFTAAQKEL